MRNGHFRYRGTCIEGCEDMSIFGYKSSHSTSTAHPSTHLISHHAAQSSPSLLLLLPSPWSFILWRSCRCLGCGGKPLCYYLGFEWHCSALGGLTLRFSVLRCLLSTTCFCALHSFLISTVEPPLFNSKPDGYAVDIRSISCCRSISPMGSWMSLCLYSHSY